MSSNTCDVEGVRSSLLRFYTMEVTAHAGYILTLVIVFPQIFFSDDVKVLLWDKFTIYCKNPPLGSMLWWMSLTGYLIFSSYIVGRTLWWGAFLTAILQVKIEEENQKSDLPLHQTLQTASYDLIKKRAETNKLWEIRAFFSEPKKIVYQFYFWMFICAIIILIYLITLDP